jgi:hypothetical protein
VIAKSNRAKVECASLVILATSSKWKSRQVETVPGAMIPRFQSSSAAVRSARPRWKGWIPMSERVIGFFCSGQRQSFTTGGIPQAESLVVLVVLISVVMESVDIEHCKVLRQNVTKSLYEEFDSTF